MLSRWSVCTRVHHFRCVRVVNVLSLPFADDPRARVRHHRRRVHPVDAASEAVDPPRPAPIAGIHILGITVIISVYCPVLMCYLRLY